MDYVSKIQVPGGTTYNITGVIPMGTVASTSTSTVYTATISGITELKSGVCVWLTNGVVTSAANFTININGLGAKPVYRSNAATTRETTRFDKAYTIFLIYNETRVSGGCWDYVYGFDSNTTYTNMSQTEASAGTVTTGRVISAKVLSTTIEEHTAEINAVLPELVDEGAKNKLPITVSSQVVGEAVFTVNADNSISVYTTATTTALRSIALVQAADNFYVYSTDIVSGVPSTDKDVVIQFGIGTSGNIKNVEPSVGYIAAGVSGYIRYMQIIIRSGVSIPQSEPLIFKPMICSKADWDISQEYVPYALPNPELTAASIETVNNGAKNEFCFDSIGTIINDDYICAKQFSANGVTFTLNADNTVTATRTESSNYDSGCILMYNGKPAYIDSFFDATHIVSGCPAGGTANTYSIGISTKAVGPDSGVYDLGEGLVLPTKQEIPHDDVFVNIRYGSSYSGTITYKPMICTIPQWINSREYQPHALPNSKLTAATIEAIDDGAKNKLSIGSPTSVPTGLTCVRNGDGTYTVSGTLTAANSISFNIDAIEGDLVLSGCPEGGGDTTYLLRITKSGSQVADSVDTGIGSNVFTMSGTGYALNIRFAAGTYTDVIFKPMICTKAAWDISQEYVPYALPNPELTAAAIEVIDSGTKNLLEHIAFTRTVNDVTYTVNADRSIQISSAGNNTQSLLYLVQNYTGVPAGNYVLSGCTGGSSTKYDLRVKVGNTTYINYDGGTEFYYNGTDNFESSIVVRASQTVNTTIKPMVCTKADWGISHSYQPYRPNIMDAVFGPGTEIIGTSEAHQDLNNYNTPGAYFCRNSTNAGYVDNKPLGGSGFRLTVENISGTNTFRQTFIKPTDASRIYIRHYSTSTWSPWYVFEGTVVT